MARVALIASLIAVVVGIVACGESKEDKARAQVCSARADISKQVDQLKSLTLTTATTTKVKDGLASIRNSLGDIRTSRKDLSGQRKKDVQAANDAFTSTVRQTLAKVGTSVSVDDASAQIKGALDQLATSYSSSLGALKCP
jgi:Tfp pilus assembly protein PilP